MNFYSLTQWLVKGKKETTETDGGYTEISKYEIKKGLVMFIISYRLGGFCSQRDLQVVFGWLLDFYLV